MARLHHRPLSTAVCQRYQATEIARSSTRDHSSEARVWWLDGEPILVGPHPDDPGARPEADLTSVHTAVSRLGCRFVTTDIARRVDGTWRVIEVGDGQVSDLPAGVYPMELIGPLTLATSKYSCAVYKFRQRVDCFRLSRPPRTTVLARWLSRPG
ncbi:ATP-grasp domain-containing protein [Nocardia salmonicida]|uniref:ATP-grasp domain-containing protein n=1 Tax=Nocardia salmonicida TaxID=53431 RepID=UPI00364DBB60